MKHGWIPSTGYDRVVGIQKFHRGGVSIASRPLPRNLAMGILTVERHYMIQPLVELYGGCMVVLKVS